MCEPVGCPLDGPTVPTTVAAHCDAAYVNEDGTVVIDVIDNDCASDGRDPHVTGITTPPSFGVALVRGDGTIAYTPFPDFFTDGEDGVDTFTYQARSADGVGNAEAVVSVVVQPLADAIDDGSAHYVVPVGGELLAQPLPLFNPDGVQLSNAIPEDQPAGFSLNVEQGTFSYVEADDDPAAVGTARTLTVTVTALTEVPAPGSAQSTITIEVVANTWTGAVSEDWDDDDNWTGGVPTSGEAVYVPHTENRPFVSSAGPLRRVGTLLVDPSGFVTLGSSAVLEVSGDLLLPDGGIGVVGAGTLRLTTTGNTVPQPAQMRGSIGQNVSLEIMRWVKLTGDTSAAGPVFVEWSEESDVNGILELDRFRMKAGTFTLTAEDALPVDGTVLHMADPRALLDVTTDLSWSTNVSNTVGRSPFVLTGGEISVGGNFSYLEFGDEGLLEIEADGTRVSMTGSGNSILSLPWPSALSPTRLGALTLGPGAIVDVVSTGAPTPQLFLQGRLELRDGARLNVSTLHVNQHLPPNQPDVNATYIDVRGPVRMLEDLDVRGRLSVLPSGGQAALDVGPHTLLVNADDAVALLALRVEMYGPTDGLFLDDPLSTVIVNSGNAQFTGGPQANPSGRERYQDGLFVFRGNLSQSASTGGERSFAIPADGTLTIFEGPSVKDLNFGRPWSPGTDGSHFGDVVFLDGLVDAKSALPIAGDAEISTTIDVIGALTIGGDITMPTSDVVVTIGGDALLLTSFPPVNPALSQSWSTTGETRFHGSDTLGGPVALDATLRLVSGASLDLAAFTLDVTSYHQTINGTNQGLLLHQADATFLARTGATFANNSVGAGLASRWLQGTAFLSGLVQSSGTPSDPGLDMRHVGDDGVMVVIGGPNDATFSSSDNVPVFLGPTQINEGFTFSMAGATTVEIYGPLHVDGTLEIPAQTTLRVESGITGGASCTITVGGILQDIDGMPIDLAGTGICGL